MPTRPGPAPRSPRSAAPSDGRLAVLAAGVLVVLTAGVASALTLPAPAGAPAPVAVVATAPAAPVPVHVLAATATEPVLVEAPAEPPPAPVPAPAAPARAARASAPARPAPAPDPLCSGAGWEQRRGQAALEALRRPSDASRFTVGFEPGRDDFLGLATVHERRLEVFVRSCDAQSDALLRHVVAHELGHLVDGDRMTDALREEYRRLRGIPAGTPWFGCNSCADFATPAGDFAEVYAQWQRGATSNRSQLAPAPSKGELADLAARFFG